MLGIKQGDKVGELGGSEGLLISIASEDTQLGGVDPAVRAGGDLTGVMSCCCGLHNNSYCIIGIDGPCDLDAYRPGLAFTLYWNKHLHVRNLIEIDLILL